eukprot:symbB.v1.2.004209.t1/scaffold215.1/size331178/2
MVSNNTRIEVLCESTGDLYQLGCQTYSSFSPSTWEATENPGATSAYLAISCDTTDNDGLRDASNDNESASSYLMGDGNPYFYLEYDTRDMQLGVHYRLCEDLDGANSIASFNWPGIVVYLGGVTSMATVLRDPKDGPVVIAALGQGLLLNCLYGSCSTSTEAYLALNCDSSDNSTDRSEWASFTFRGSTDEWQWELQDWDLSNLTNGTTYKLCTDFDGKDQSPLESGFSGLRVPVTPITHISEESIQAATNQQVLLVCYGCMHIERYCDTFVGCPATDPIYIVSSAYLSNKDCNYSDYDGFQMEEGDWTTLSSPLRPTSNSTRASSLSASPGKESIVYNTEVIFDSSAMVDQDPSNIHLIAKSSATLCGLEVPGYVYLGLCMDLDGSSSDFSFHDTGFSVYITPVSVVRQKVLIIGATTRLEFSCQGTGSVSSTCSTSSAVYLAQSCDLNRNSGVVATWEIHTSDASPSEAVTEIPGAEGSSYEFRVELNLTHLQVGWNYRLCIDTDTAGPLYFGDSGFAVDLSGVQGIYPSDTLQMSAVTALDLYCPQYCVTSVTTAYLARESVGCDGSASDTFTANGEENTAAATLTTATQPDAWQVASYFTRDFTVTFDTSALKAGESYVLCVDYDGPGSVGFANAYDGVVKMNPIVPESPALEATSTATLPLTCNACNLSTIIYLATACNVDAVISGNKEFCQVSWNLVPPQTCSNLLEANFPTNSGFVRLFPRTTLPGTDRWLAYLDTSGLTVGVVYRLCSDLDGGFTEQGFLDVGQVIITGIQKAQRSISTAATRHEWTGGSKQAFIFTCSSECTVGTTLVYLASMCDSSSDSNPLKTAVAGEQTAPVTIELLTSWSSELLPQRSVVLHGQDNSAEVFIFGGAGTKYIVMLDTSELTIGQFYKMCVDHDGTSGWFVGDTGLRVLATDLVVDVSIQRGSHEALSVNCTSGCSSLMAFLSVNCDEVSLGQVATAFANAAEGTLPNTLSRFSGPRLFSGQDTDNETVTDTPSIITGDTYTLYLDTSVLQLGQTYALCVDYDGYGSTAEVGDSGRRVYVTGVTQLLDERIWKATNQVVQLRCNSGECSSNMRIYLSLSCDFTVLDGTASAVADVQTDSWRGGVFVLSCVFLVSLRMSTLLNVDMGKSFWSFFTSRYFRIMTQYLIHSALANGIFWIKLTLLSLVGIICFFFPLFWPLLGFWIYSKYQTYKASCGKLLPAWTGPGTLEQRVLKAIEKNEPPNQGQFTSRDGLRLQYYSEGRGQKHVLICNGVNCSYLLWKPLFDSLSESFGKDWREHLTVITWDYRGLYKSEAPSSTASFSVRALCEDAYDLLQHLKLEKWDAVCGWSTGVQCSLEYAGLYPDTVDRLFLVNGSHGHTLHTAFQPMPQFFFLSLMSRILSSAIYFVRFSVCTDAKEFQKFKQLWVAVNELVSPTLQRLNGFLLGRASLEYTMASNALDLTGHGPEHCNNVMRILQALDSHSSAYNLPELKVPVLVVCGLLDFMTPAFTQYEIAGLAPKVKLIPIAAGTHHCILESPDLATGEIARFFEADQKELEKWGDGSDRVGWPVGWYLL